MYDFEKSLKSSVSDELVNTYLIRPIAGRVVKALYDTSVTPNQVTIASTVVGLIAALFYLVGLPGTIMTAGILVTLKDVLDSADGQLARAKNQYTRTGRFMDSIGDFAVNFVVFGAIGLMLYRANGDIRMFVLAFLGFVGLTFRVSYHVFYHTSFLHLKKQYQINRVTEEVKDIDLRGDPLALKLQKIFQLLYGWQDKLVARIDYWCRQGKAEEEFLKDWYSDVTALRLSGFLGLGTELFVLMFFSVFSTLELYLVVNVLVMNGLLAVCIIYRFSLFTKLAE